MASKRSGSKDIDGSTTGAAIERVPTSLSIYEDTKLIVDKEIKLKWKEVNDAFVGTFGEDLKDHKVYMNIHKFGLYLIVCRYLAFPCADMIHWIILHIDPETMTLSSVSGMKIATFRAHNYDEMYHISKPMIIMETPFSIPNNNTNSK